MTDNDKQPQGGALAGNTVIVAALLAAVGAFFYREAPLLPSRPTAGEPVLDAGSRVYAPLWQDPFVAVAQAVKSPAHQASSRSCRQLGSSGDTPADNSTIRIASGDAPGADRHDDAIRLAVTVTAGPNYEDVEYRRRLRYAVLTGLDRAGFQPKDARLLSYCFLGSRVYPLEWFEAKDAGGASHRSGRDQLLLVWVDEDAFGDDPLSQLDALRQSIANSEPLSVLGPQSSDTLVKMTKRRPGAAHDIRIFSYGVTAEKPCASPGEDCLGERDVEFSRTIASDDRLADAIAEELDKRGVIPGDSQHVALVAEMDSIYGRTLLETMARRLAPPRGEGSPCCGGESIVHKLGYFKGLDGAIAKADSGEAAKNETTSSRAEDDDAAKTQIDARTLELPYGKSQYDYLRRLAERLGETHRRLRAEGKDGIRAIGVLGSDAFDKLLVLRALKPAFPYAQFFTTDFDTVLTTIAERDWTRNLLVASSLGSQLRPELQGMGPPFRSGYQTAAFLATQLAVAAATRAPRRKAPCGAGRARVETNRAPLLVADSPTALSAEGDRRTARAASGSTRRADRRRIAAREAAARRRGSSAWTAVATPTDSPAQDPSDPASVCDLSPAGAGETNVGAMAHLDRARFARWFDEASLFEVTRTGELLPLPRHRVEYSTKPALCDGDILACDGIQPQSGRLYPPLGVSARIGLAALLALTGAAALAYAYMRRESRRLSRDQWCVDWAWIGALLIFCALVAASWEQVALALTQDGVGERIALLDGVSIWPSTLIALGATLASIRLIARACAMLDGNLDEIAAEMKLPEPAKIVEGELMEMRNESGWRNFERIFFYRMRDGRAALASEEERGAPNKQEAAAPGGSSVTSLFWFPLLAASWTTTRTSDEAARGEGGDAPRAPAKTVCVIDELWKVYVGEGRSRARLLRSGVASAGVVLLLVLFTWSFASQHAPIRGDVSRAAAALGDIGQAFFVSMLVFVVLDASFRCLRFVQQLARGSTRWPQRTIEEFKSSLGKSTTPSDASTPRQASAPDNILNDMIDLTFIEMRTKCVNTIVYYPFCVIAVVMVAQSSVFSPYPPSAVMFVAEGLGLLAIFVCVMAFRRVAEGARAAARAHILEADIRTKGKGVDESWRPEQLDKLLARLENMTDGAFGSFWRQPAIRALSAPVASLGLTNLLDLRTPLGF